MTQERVQEEEGYYRLSPISRNCLTEQGIDPNWIEFTRWLVRNRRINEGPGFDSNPYFEDVLIAGVSRQADFSAEIFPEVSRSLTDLDNLCFWTEKEVCEVNVRRGGEPSKLPGKPWQDRQILDQEGSYNREIQLLAFSETEEVRGLRLEASYYCSLVSAKGQLVPIDGLRLCFYDDRIEMTEGKTGVQPAFMFNRQPVQVVYFGSVNLSWQERDLVRKAQMVLGEYLGE